MPDICSPAQAMGREDKLRAQCPTQGLFQPYLLAQMTGLSYLCLLLLSGWSCLKELNGKLNTVNVSILLLKFGVLLARDKGRAACNTDSGTNHQCKGCKHPGFRVPIWSFPFRLLWSTGKFCFQGRKNNFSLWYKQTQTMGSFDWSKTTLWPKREALLSRSCKEEFSVNKLLAESAAQSRAFSDLLHGSKLPQNPLSITRSNSPSEGLVMLSCYYRS